MGQHQSLYLLSPRPLLVAILVGILFGQIYADGGQTNSALTWSQKGQKSGAIAPKPFDRTELVSIAARLQHLKGIGTASTALSNGSSALKSLVQKGAPVNVYFDSALSTTRDWNIRWHERNGTPIFISNLNVSRQMLSVSATATGTQVATSFVEHHKSLFRLDNPTEELLSAGETSDNLGKKHIRLQQVYSGIPIWGHELIIHLEPSGSLYAVSARYCPTPRNLDLASGRISSDEAISVATNDLSNRTKVQTIDSSLARLLNYSGPESKLCILVNDSTQQPYLAWFVQIRPNIIDDWYYFVDARSGEVLHKYNNTNFDGPATASATDLNGVVQTLNTYLIATTYYLIDASRPIWKPVQPDIVNDPRGALLTATAGGTYFAPVGHVTSPTNTWSDPVAVSAHNNVARTFQYYYTTFGRKGIDDSGTTVLSIVHVTDALGQSLDNAFWTDGLMAYGDGGPRFKPLAAALDVAAHEMTHGVIQHTVKLNPEGQSGALNESFADVFGCMIDSSNWLIGEDIVKLSAFPSGAMRNMANPHNGGTYLDYYWQPAHMSEYQTDTSDFGGVHVNSGIPNKAAYLIGSSIGRSKLERVYYRILDARYLTTGAQFVDMRLAAVQSATDLYGSASAEVATVKSAFDSVGILDGTGTPQPPDAPAKTGDQWVAVVNAELTDHSLYKAKPDSSGVIVQLTTTQVLTTTGRPIAVTSDGRDILFIDSSHFIRTIATDGSNEQIISATGEWSSIALSPDSRKLAATTIYEDSSIYIFDLQYPDSTKIVRLYSPTTQQGMNSNITRFADALDWNSTGEYLIYDALSSVPQSGGGAIDSWSIFLLEVATKTIFLLFPPLPPGIHMGNPAFANTNDIYVACDLLNSNTDTNYVYAVNLFTGVAGLIENNGSSIGFPDYSTNDGRIVFQRIEAGSATLRQIGLDANRIAPTGASFPWLIDASLPTWFVVTSPADVTEPTDIGAIPRSFSLLQNYPNPFNPATKIEFTLTHSASVSVEVFNVLGERVRNLVSGRLPAGRKVVSWDGRDDRGQALSSGVYFYRLTSGDFVETKKMVLLK